MGEAVGQLKISIHALREEGDAAASAKAQNIFQFLSTPSARRATAAERPPLLDIIFLSTPSARRATSGCNRVIIDLRFLSTPSARRATLTILHIKTSLKNFYPRPPRGGRPERCIDERAVYCISIHALREEGDLLPMRSGHPRSRFLSTPSARRATIKFERISSQQSYFYPRPPRGGRPVSG